MQIIVYTSVFSGFINKVYKIMIQSNAKSLVDTTAMLYKQTASSKHGVCLDQRSFKCKIGELCSNIISNRGKIQILSSLLTLWKSWFIAILLGVCLSCLENNNLPSFPRSNIHNRRVKYVTV